MPTRVSDLSIDELKSLIHEVVAQTIKELLRDPDDGLELQEDFKIALQHSLNNIDIGEQTQPAEAVVGKLGLRW
jgi:hypothetical protein